MCSAMRNSPGYEHGFVSGELLSKYVPVKDVTYFLCGPKAMYEYLAGQMAPVAPAGESRTQRRHVLSVDLSMDNPPHLHA